VQTWQDDDEFAFCTERRAVDFSGESSGISRESELEGLPCEIVARVDVRLNDRCNVSELLLEFEHGAEVLLVAGESEEQADGRLLFKRNDESVLLSATLRTWRGSTGSLDRALACAAQHAVAADGLRRQRLTDAR
jgi:hypothetical protein